MPAMPISWHEECLRNSIEFYEERRKRIARELERQMADEKNAVEQMNRLAKQIERAKRLGKESFDSERFRPE